MTAPGDGTGDAQRQLDMRAIELATKSHALAESLDRRMTRHEDECMEERRQAAKQRHDFRAEMALTLGALRTEVQTGFKDGQQSNSRVHGRINAILVAFIVAGGTVIPGLLGLSGYLFIKAIGW